MYNVIKLYIQYNKIILLVYPEHSAHFYNIHLYTFYAYVYI